MVICVISVLPHQPGSEYARVLLFPSQTHRTCIALNETQHDLFFDQSIMKDRWMNIGFEDRELKPYQEPSKDQLDPERIGKCVYVFRVLSNH